MVETVNNMNFLCFDTEDNSKELLSSGQSGFDKRVTQIAMITAEGERYYNKGDVPVFKKKLSRCKEKYFYAHNLQYDLGNLFGDELDQLDCTLVGGRLIKAVWGKKIFVDSFNIWPMSAKKLGEAFGLKKLETENMATDKEYVFRDVEIIRQAMLFAWQFCGELGINNLPPTLGGLCVRLWKHWGGENCHDSTLLSREALYGGRVELFKICDWKTWEQFGQKKMYKAVKNELPANEFSFILDNENQYSVGYTDINSLYPFVMTKKYPGVLADCGKELMDYGIAKVTMNVPESDIVILPFRNDERRILYPWGKFTGVWTVEEIRAAESEGVKIVKVHDAYGTNDADHCYASFMQRLYAARLTSNSEAEKLFFKLLMNNLYGRLGTSGKIGRTVWQTDKNKHDGVPFGEKVLVNYNMPLSEEVNWCHAAYVTGYGRLELYKYLKIIGAKDLIYCDTDSAIFDCPSKHIPFQISKEIGQMKNEGFNPGAIAFAPKLYQTGKTVKAKGVPQRLAREFLERGHVHFDLPFKFREAVNFFDRDNAKKLSVWRTVQKFKRSGYDRKKLIGNQFFPCKINAV